MTSPSPVPPSLISLSLPPILTRQFSLLCLPSSLASVILCLLSLFLPYLISLLPPHSPSHLIHNLKSLPSSFINSSTLTPPLLLPRDLSPHAWSLPPPLYLNTCSLEHDCSGLCLLGHRKIWLNFSLYQDSCRSDLNLASTRVPNED